MECFIGTCVRKNVFSARGCKLETMEKLRALQEEW